MAADRESPSPSEQVARRYERAESQAAKAGEHLVGTQGFASLLGQVAENAAALTKLGNDAMDLVIRNLRVAGRRDIVRLGRQLARTEDKLERVLQELEDVRDELRERDEGAASAHAVGEAARERSRNGAGTAPARARRAARSGRSAESGESAGGESTGRESAGGESAGGEKGERGENEEPRGSS